MADAQDTTPIEGEVEAQAPVASNRHSQAAYDKARKAAKEAAAKVVEANAKEAAAAKKKAQSQAPKVPGLADFNKRAHQIELEINAPAESAKD